MDTGLEYQHRGLEAIDLAVSLFCGWWTDMYSGGSIDHIQYIKGGGV
jgi:hypothetical protein